MISYHTRAPTLPDVTHRRKYLRILDPITVRRLAMSISERLGFTIAEPEKLMDRLRQNETTMYFSRDYTLWVNRHYIAVMPYGINGVIYLYVTRHHVTEEMRTDHALCMRRRPSALDSKVRSQFTCALGAMDREHRDYAVRRSMIGGTCEGIDLRTPWT